MASIQIHQPTPEHRNVTPARTTDFGMPIAAHAYVHLREQEDGGRVVLSFTDPELMRRLARELEAGAEELAALLQTTPTVAVPA